MGLLKVIVEEELYDKDIVDNWVLGFDELQENLKTFTLDDVEKVAWVPQQQIKEFARLYDLKQLPMREIKWRLRHQMILQVCAEEAILSFFPVAPA